MAAPKKSKSDPYFMPNLEKALREEVRRRAKVLPPPREGEEGGEGPSPPAAEPIETAPARRRKQRGRGEGEPEPEAPDRETLLKELRGLLGKLDAEGLSFLLEQARVHLYNMEVERQNAALVQPPAGAKGRAAKTPSAKAGLSLERSSSGSSYYLSSGGDSAMFSAEEMLALVRIAFGGAESEAGTALGAWLRRERGDALDSLGLGPKDAAGLAKLAAFLRSKFRDPSAKGRG